MKKLIMCLALALVTNYVTADTVTLKGTVDLSTFGNLTTTNSAGTAYNYPAVAASPNYTYYVDSNASSSASNTLWDLDLGTNQLYYAVNDKNFYIYAASITNSATGTIRIRSSSNNGSPLYLYTTGSIYLTSLVSDFSHINGACAKVTINSGSSVTITGQIKTEKVDTADRSSTGAGDITITAATNDITIKDILARGICAANTTVSGGDITLNALNGDVVVAGVIDAYCIGNKASGWGSVGDLTISATNGAITLANLDVGLVRNISLRALTGTSVSITNLITGLTVDNGAGKVTGPFLVTTTSNNITYHSALQTALGLKGNYNIYQLNGTTDVGYDLIDLDENLPSVADVGLSGNAGTTSADVVALLNVRAATNNTLEIFYDTTDHTNQAALWQPPNVVGSYLSVTNLFVTNTVTATELNPNTTYYYRFALSNETTGVRSWQPQASRSFVTAGPINTVTLTGNAALSPNSGSIATTNASGNAYNYASYVQTNPYKVNFFIDNSAVITASNTLWNLNLNNYSINYTEGLSGLYDPCIYAKSVTSGVGRIYLNSVNNSTVSTLKMYASGAIYLPEVFADLSHENGSVMSVYLSGASVIITNRVVTSKNLPTKTRTSAASAGTISIVATEGDITVGARGLDSSINMSATSKMQYGGDITLNAAGNVIVNGPINARGKNSDNLSLEYTTYTGDLGITAGGDITLASLNVTNVYNIVLSAGASGTITVLGAIEGLVVDGGTPRKVTGTFPTLNKDIYYYPKQNVGVLTGTYLIYNGATDTGRKLISAVSEGTIIRFF